MLGANGGRCSLTDLVARFTAERQLNFDICLRTVRTLWVVPRVGARMAELPPRLHRTLSCVTRPRSRYGIYPVPLFCKMSLLKVLERIASWASACPAAAVNRAPIWLSSSG